MSDTAVSAPTDDDVPPAPAGLRSENITPPPNPLAIAAARATAARAKGYSDQDIAGLLGGLKMQGLSDKVQDGIQRGYAPTDIVDHVINTFTPYEQRVRPKAERALTGLAQGATEGVSQAAQGIAEAETRRPFFERYYNSYENYAGLNPTQRGQVNKDIMSDPKLTPGDRSNLMSRMQDVQDGFKPVPFDEFAGKPPAQTDLAQAGQAVQKFGEKNLYRPLTKAENQTLVGQVSKGVGTMLPGMAAGAVSGPLGMGLGAATMGGMAAKQTADEARAHHLDPRDIADAANTSGAINTALGAVDFGTFLKPIERTSPGLVPWAASKLQQFVHSGMMFGSIGEVQEALGQEVAHDFYNPKAGYSPDVARFATSALTGGLVGAAGGTGYRPEKPGLPADVSLNMANIQKGLEDYRGLPPAPPQAQAPTPPPPQPQTPMPQRPVRSLPDIMTQDGVGQDQARAIQAQEATKHKAVTDYLTTMANKPVRSLPDIIAQDGVDANQARATQDREAKDRGNATQLLGAQGTPVAGPETKTAAQTTQPQASPQPPTSRPDGSFSPGRQAMQNVSEGKPATAGISEHPKTETTIRGVRNPDGTVTVGPAQVPTGQPQPTGPAIDVAGNTPTAMPPESVPPRRTPDSAAPPSQGVVFKPGELTIDPERFQYKAANEKGVTGALRGTDQWEPELANPITVWAGNDGKNYVVNGHQRYDLATRAEAAGQEGVGIPAKVYREADGYTPDYMRALGAFQNIAEGSGTPLDAARVMRAIPNLPPGLRLPTLPPQSPLVRGAYGLTKLSDEAFGAVEHGAIQPEYASQVGQLIEDPAQQLAMLNMLIKANPTSTQQARFMVQDAKEAGFLAGAQTTLFGDVATATPLLASRSRVADAAINQLTRVTRAAGTALKREDELTAMGNQLNRAGNMEAKTKNERLVNLIRDEATKRGAVSDALTEAATAVANGEPVRSASDRFIEALSKLARRPDSERVEGGNDERGPNAEGTPAAEGEAAAAGSGQRAGATTGGVEPKIREKWRIEKEDGVGPQEAAATQARETQAFRAWKADQSQKQGDVQFSKRLSNADEERVARVADVGHPAGREVRERIARSMLAVMRHFGLPDSVGLDLVEHLSSPEGQPANSSYSAAKKLITFALDTKPEQANEKLFHEIVHGLMDPQLGLLGKKEIAALGVGARKYLQNPEARKTFERLYGKNQATLEKEVNAFVAEGMLGRVRGGTPLVRDSIDKFKNLIDGIKQVFHGQGYKTSQDVYDAVLRGDVGRRSPSSPRAEGPVGSRSAADTAKQIMEMQGLDKFSKRDQDAEKQDEMFPKGGEATQAQAARDAQGNLKAKVKQDPAKSLPLFEERPEQPELFSLRDDMQDTLRAQWDNINALRDNDNLIAKALFPMHTGSEFSQASAHKFASRIRATDWQFGELDKQIKRDFPKGEDRGHIGWAMDNQSVFEQLLKQDTEHMTPTQAQAYETKFRGWFDKLRIGLTSLNPEERALAENLNQMATRVWSEMRKRGIVSPNADGIPYYMPRMSVIVGDKGKATKLPRGPGSGPLFGGQSGKIKSGSGGLTDVHPMGYNLTTQGPMFREHLTREAYEDAVKARFGQNATPIDDIRILPLALARNIRAIHGRDFVNEIKKYGEGIQQNFVTNAVDDWDRSHYWTMDHPALRVWSPLLEKMPDGSWQQVIGPNGKPAFEPKLMHISRDFEGPMKAVLTEKNPAWYKAMMALKNISMTAIMWSPGTHLNVEIGRAFPAFGVKGMLTGQVFSTMFSAKSRALLANPQYMDRAIREGMAPIAAGMWRTDPATVANEWLGRDTKFTPWGLIQKFHDWALWRQIRTLQVGIYDDMRTKLIDAGMPEGAAGINAAHIANRYAGALPAESTSRFGNVMANMFMFSRSFTGGNLGVMKDMTNGMPSHIYSRIKQEFGQDVADQSRTFQRRKAQSAVGLDIGVNVIGNAMLQTLFKGLGIYAAYSLSDTVKQVYDDWLAKTKAGLDKFWNKNDPTGLLETFPQYNNEPGKGDRVLLGVEGQGFGPGGAGKGRTIYIRPMFGKLGEEFANWIFAPASQLMNKTSTIMGPIFESIRNADSLGRPVWRPNPRSIPERLGVVKDVIGHILYRALVPNISRPVSELIHGEANTMTAVEGAGLATGLFTTSYGYPGGPQAGIDRAKVDQHRYDVQAVMPTAHRQLRAGDVDGARETMKSAHMSNKEIKGAIQRFNTPQKSASRLHKQAEKIRRAEQEEEDEQ